MDTQAIMYYKDRPIEFVRDIIGAEPDEIQCEILESVAHNQLTSVRSGHGIGKSALQSWLIIWFICTRPFPKVPCTAPTKHQLYDILWAEVAKWMNNVPQLKNELEWTYEKLYMKGHQENWFAVPRTATQPDALQGFHSEHLLYIIDEASGVKDSVFEPVLGSLSTSDSKLIMCGNPTQLSGFFFDSHNKNREIYKTFKVSGENSKRVSKEYIQMIIDMYGKDSDVYRVRVAGEFPKANPDSFIQLDWVENCSIQENKLPEIFPKVIDIGADIARYGDDESVICSLYDKTIEQPLNTIFHNDTMQITGKLVIMIDKYLKQFNKVKINVKIDCDGLGVGVYDRLVEIKDSKRNWDNVEIYECHFGGKGGTNDNNDPIEFANSTGLMWGLIREKLRNNKLTLVYDDKQISQLSNRKYAINSDGKIQLEKKEDMKKRGLHSPDRADALALAIYDPPTAKVFIK